MKIKIGDDYHTVHDYLYDSENVKTTLKGNKINVSRITNIYDVMGGVYNGGKKENNSKKHK